MQTETLRQFSAGALAGATVSAAVSAFLGPETAVLLVPLLASIFLSVVGLALFIAYSVRTLDEELAVDSPAHANHDL